MGDTPIALGHWRWRKLRLGPESANRVRVNVGDVLVLAHAVLALRRAARALIGVGFRAAKVDVDIAGDGQGRRVRVVNLQEFGDAVAVVDSLLLVVILDLDIVP